MIKKSTHWWLEALVVIIFSIPVLVEAKCKQELAIPAIDKNQVFKKVPFKSGERAIYKISYMGIHAGFGTMNVGKPFFYNGHWQRVIDAFAETGSWYKWVFVAQDRVRSISRAVDFGASWFFIDQDEGALLRDRFLQTKTLVFDDNRCDVEVKVTRKGKHHKTRRYELQHGAMDAVSAVYWMRSQDYKIGQRKRGLVFTSEKNWWFDVMPLGFEYVDSPLGKLKTVKLKLTTSIGDRLQQKGDVYAWVAVEHAHRPLIQVKAEIAIGSVYMVIDQFKGEK